MSFDKDWKKESEAAIKATQETVKVAAIELFSGVILSSPVGNPSLWKNPNSAEPGYSGGAFRSNSFLSFNQPSTKTTDATNEESARLGEINAISTMKYSHTYFLTNNLPYAERLDQGYSTQAPLGVTQPNLSRVRALIPRIAATANKKFGV